MTARYKPETIGRVQGSNDVLVTLWPEGKLLVGQTLLDLDAASQLASVIMDGVDRAKERDAGETAKAAEAAGAQQYAPSVIQPDQTTLVNVSAVNVLLRFRGEAAAGEFARWARTAMWPAFEAWRHQAWKGRRQP